MKYLTLLLFLFITNANIHSQAACENVFFSVTYNDSDCTGLDDEFCINLHPMFSDPACFDFFESDYIWRVEFLNSDFNITNLGPFAVNSNMSTNGSTVIEVNAMTAFGIVSFLQGCFSGEILANDATFIFTFESMDGLEIIETLNFTPDNIKTIKEDMTVTEAIAQGLLVSANQANEFTSEPQKIRIAAHLTIDQDYAFRNGSQVIMISDESKITVNPNINLSVTDHADIKGCDVIWDQIENNGSLIFLRGSSIADAKIGIKSSDGSSLSTFGIIVENCVTGIDLSGSAAISFGGGDFIIDCNTGMKLNNLNQSLMIPEGYFEACERGIDASQTNLIITDCSFINNTAPGYFFPNGAAVVSKNSDIFLSQDCSFIQNDVGITLSDISSIIIQRTHEPFVGANFSQNFADILILSELSQVVNINNTGFKDATIHNIFLGMQPGIANIKDNTFEGNANNIFRGSANVSVNAIGHGQHRIFISENDMESNNTNVSFRNTNRASVYDNTSLVAGDIGVSVQGGQMNNIGSNNSIASINDGIYLESSPFSNVLCNNSVVSENTSGLTISGPNHNTEVLRNGLISELGLTYTSTATTGIQINKRNLFLQNNHFQNEPRAIHGGNTPNNDRYFVNNINFNGLTTFPEFSANSPEWFTIFERSGKECPAKIEPHFGDDNLIVINDIPNVLSLINQIEESPVVDTDSLFVTTYPIYKTLKTLHDNCSSNCLETLFDQWMLENKLQNSEVLNLFTFIFESENGTLQLDFDVNQWLEEVTPLFEDMYQYDMESQNLGNWQYSNELIAQQLNDDILLLTASYQRHIVELNQSDTVLIDSTNYFQQAIDNKISILSELHADQKIINNNVLNELVELNNSINVPHFTTDNHFKEVNEIAIGLMKDVEESQFLSDTSYLKSIANGCPFTLGSTKYHAQSLYQNLTKYTGTFVDNCSSVVPRIRNYTVTSVNKPESFNVYPNPSNNYIYIEKTNMNNPAVEYIFIYDAFGKLVTELNFHEAKMEIDISKYPEGVYFIKGLKENVLNKFVKIN